MRGESKREKKRQADKKKAEKKRRVEELEKEQQRQRALNLKKKAAARKKHELMMKEHARARKKKQAAKAIQHEQHQASTVESQEEAIQRHQREVELSFDAGVLEETLREMFSKHGEIEYMKKNIKGGLDIRFVSERGAKSLLKSQKKNNKINATMSFPVTPVVIKQHCFYYKPVEYIIDQEVLNATAEYFSSISVVQQVKKFRNAVLVVFEDQQARDEMVKKSEKTNWKINGRSIGACSPGLPPAVNKRKAPKPLEKKRKKQATNGRN